MCVRDSKNSCFHKIRVFDAKPQEIYFMMALRSILESFCEPSWLTYSLSVAPVTNIADMVDTFFQTRKNDSLGFDPGW